VVTDRVPAGILVGAPVSGDDVAAMAVGDADGVLAVGLAVEKAVAVAVGGSGVAVGVAVRVAVGVVVAAGVDSSLIRACEVAS